MRAEFDLQTALEPGLPSRAGVTAAGTGSPAYDAPGAWLRKKIPGVVSGA